MVRNPEAGAGIYNFPNPIKASLPRVHTEPYEYSWAALLRQAYVLPPNPDLMFLRPRCIARQSLGNLETALGQLRT